jgi:hypothetical protein
MSKPVDTESTESTENEQSAFQDKIDQARAQYGKVIAVEIDGELLIFRRPKRAELVNMNKAARKQPELAIEHAIGLCRVCHIGPGKRGIEGDVDRFSDMYTLLFAGSDDFKGISDHLIELSRGEAKITLS